METVIVSNSQFYSHYPRKIPKGSVNAEQVEIRLDKSWDGLTVRIHWLNVASDVEKVVPLERDQPNTIPWEVLTDLGELRMGLVGLDGETVIKPTIWLTYGYVVEGVDPESGSDPQPPTPSWEQQMVALAEAAANAAKAAKEASEEAAQSAGAAGPYVEEAKKSAEAAKESQKAADTSAKQANEAAQTAQQAAGSIGDSVDRAEGAATEAGEAKQAAETAQAAASNSAGTAQGAATTASKAAQTAKEAATQAGEYLATVKEDANNAESAALEAGKSQEAARDAAQEAANAREQANTAATAADTAKDAAEQAATNAGNAQSGAAQSAQSAADSSKAAETAKQEAQKAAATLPAPSKEFAGKALVVNEEGNGYSFVDYLQSLGFELVDTITPNADVSILYLGEITEFRRMAVLYQRPDYVSNSPAYLRWGVRNASGYGPIIRSDNRYGQRIMGMFERISLKDFKLDYYSSLSVNQYVSDMLYAYRDDKMPNEGFYYAVFGLNQKPFDGTETIYILGERG